MYATPVTRYFVFLFVGLALAHNSASADPPIGNDSEADLASTLVFSVNRTPEPAFETARAVTIITSDEIRRRNPRNVPELLMEETGVFVQQTNYGGGSPIIRGLMGKQILIMMDGVRVNTATYRFGPIQYLNSIDVNSVERIEIVRGPDAVLAGFALGGVINIITKKGPIESGESGGLVFGRYSSSDQGLTGYANTFGRTEKLRYHAGITYHTCDDVRAGGDIGEQVATGYNGYAANLNLEFMIPRDRMLSFRYHGTQLNDVPRTDRVASGRNLVYDFDPQRLQLATLSYSAFSGWSWADSLQVTLSWNRQDEQRQEIRSSAPDVERRYYDSQNVLGLGIDMINFFGDHRVVYGVEYYTEDIESYRIDEDLGSGLLSPKRGQFTDGSSYSTLGVYVQDAFDLGKRFRVTAGLRFNRFETQGSEDSDVGELVLDGAQDEFTGSATLIFRLNTTNNMVASITRALRGPNIDDVSVFDQRPEGTEVPNPDLSAETSMNYEIGFKHESARWSGSLSVYRNQLDGLIERSTGTFNGLPFFDLDGDGEQSSDEPLVLQKQNIGEARIEGVELDFRVLVAEQWTVKGNYTRTRGTDLVADTYLSRVPPDFGTFGIRWSGSGTMLPWIEVVDLFASAQRRVSPRDAGDDRIGPNGTDGFNVVHFRGGLTLWDRLRLTLAWENVTDETYKYHASGVYRPGSQVVFGADVSF